MSVSRSPAPSSIDLSGVPARVAEAVAQVVAVCHEQFRPDPCPEAFAEAELRVRETMNALACELLGAVIEKRDDGASRIERDGQSWFRVAVTAKTIMTSLGPLTYRRARYRSGASGASPVPVDESLGLVDFWHACEHLRTASDHAVASDWFERCREVLRHDPCGVDKVIRALRHLRDSAKPDRAEIERELAFFRKHRQRMCYHTLKAEGVAIGSGVVEAANKTLVTQRMKCSGMRWRIAGGQAVLSFRALIKSARFDRAGKAIIGATDTPANDNINPCAVIAIAA